MLKNNLHYPKWNLECFPIQFHLHSEHVKIPRGGFFSQQMEVCEESKKTKKWGSSLVVQWLRFGVFTAVAQVRAQPQTKKTE